MSAYYANEGTNQDGGQAFRIRVVAKFQTKFCKELSILLVLNPSSPRPQRQFLQDKTFYSEPTDYKGCVSYFRECYYFGRFTGNNLRGQNTEKV